MARVNIEEKLFADIRFKALVRRCHSQREAQGLIQDAFFLGQKHWGNNRSLIPIAEWKIADLDLLLEVTLAETRGDYVYIKGSEDHFEWYAKKCEASRKGGLANAQRLSKIEPIDQPIGEPIGYPSQASPPTPTPTPTLNLNTNTLSVSTDPLVGHAKKTTKLDCLLFRLWNEHCGSLPKARGLTPKRWTAAMTRLKEFPDEKYWAEILEKITKSDFCCGLNDRQWKADFDFFVRPDTHLKVMEGKYDNKTGSTAKPSVTKVSDFYRDLTDPKEQNGW